MSAAAVIDIAAGAAPSHRGEPPAEARIIDLFAGPGGWDTGLAMLGRRDVIGIEWDGPACDTARAAGHARVQADVSALDPHDIVAEFIVNCILEGLIASPPCQGFSMAGKGKGRGDTPLIIAAVEQIASGCDVDETLALLRHQVADHRSALVLEPLRWALALRPRWLAWEQVPAVLPLWEACADVLHQRGYSAWTGNLQAEQYGVPQTRKRAILIASLDGEVAPPRPTHSRFHVRDPKRIDPGTPRWVSMAEALTASGFRVPGDAMRSNYGTNGDPADRGVRTVHAPAPTVTSKANRNKWVYRASNQAHAARGALHEPAPTVNFAERCNKVEWMSEDAASDVKASGVRVTVAEAAVLQSFPADYPFDVARRKGDQYRMVGDACPPLLSVHILSAAGAGALRLEQDGAA